MGINPIKNNFNFMFPAISAKIKKTGIDPTVLAKSTVKGLVLEPGESNKKNTEKRTGPENNNPKTYKTETTILISKLSLLSSSSKPYLSYSINFINPHF